VWTIDNGICIIDDSVEVTGSTPLITSAGSDISVCGNSTTLSAANPPTGFTGTWTSSNGTVVISNVNDPNTAVSNLPTGTTTFYWNVTDGICSASDSVVIDETNTVTTSAGTDSAVCGTSTILSATAAPAGYTGTWTSSSGGVTFGNVNDESTTVNNIPNGTNTFTWTITNGVCTASASVNVIINPTIIATSAGSDADICATSASLNATPAPPGFSGMWTTNNSSVTIADANDESTTASDLPFSTVTFTWTISLNNCNGTDNVLITAYEDVTADAGAAQLLCKAEGDLHAVVGTIGSGMWTIPQGNGTIADPNSNSTSVTNLGVGTNIFLWTVTNGPCLASDTVSIHYDNACLIELPTAFSPGGDNPDYHIHGIEGYPNNEFRVFNRWGNEVYFKEGYTGHDWAGENKKGEPLPDGTYYVILVIKNSDIKKNTYVDIRR
jgi:gliding motility-associated-like protein